MKEHEKCQKSQKKTLRNTENYIGLNHKNHSQEELIHTKLTIKIKASKQKKTVIVSSLFRRSISFPHSFLLHFGLCVRQLFYFSL